MPVRRRHWLVALSAALFLHLVVAIVMLWHSPTPAAVSAGMGGIEVNLGTTGVPSATEPETAEASTPVETIAEAIPAEMVEEAQVAEALPEEDVPVEDFTTAPKALEVEAVEVPEVETVRQAEPVVERIVPPKPKPKPDHQVVRKKPPPKAKRQPDPVRKRVQERPAAIPSPVQTASSTQASSTPASSATAAERPAREAPSRPAATQGSPGRHGGAKAEPADTEDGGMPGAPAEYVALLRSWLERHKEYPQRAQLRRQEGTALLHFSMDRQGRVLNYRLKRSSGYPVLDGEVEQMIRRAQPLPAVPGGFGGTRLEFVIPVRFSLR